MAAVDKVVDFQNFDLSKHEALQSACMNVMIANKVVALCSPQDKPPTNPMAFYRPAASYVNALAECGVKSIIRLNSTLYDPAPFLQHGMNHFDLYFPDGGIPSAQIISDFLFICEETQGSVAVHCRAGLGRTGTCIGLYLMKHYFWPANQAIAWLRIARPGSVMHQQQTFLSQGQLLMWQEGLSWRARQQSPPDYPATIYSGLSPYSDFILSLAAKTSRIAACVSSCVASCVSSCMSTCMPCDETSDSSSCSRRSSMPDFLSFLSCVDENDVMSPLEPNSTLVSLDVDTNVCVGN
eukprot:TRINITY_DN3868_c0_g4_i1.p1 TRINITY_DN3868_c0_g4~~TRINITY_DN3868_c0_g4_i1.p1  ORF type:complete len:295 (-),score=37.81 TRINITY_DN3868_c0_g4_i1:437-1321(-)